MAASYLIPENKAYESFNFRRVIADMGRHPSKGLIFLAKRWDLKTCSLGYTALRTFRPSHQPKFGKAFAQVLSVFLAPGVLPQQNPGLPDI
jgi:hypothetical protein